ncbi:DUF1345 domain-containing protein [Pseudactinotalea suaedae]|uniref:DUF1345 domain-containing protein n=1 Tax=Pseudactinotalea suaedae TaxID=1524924 RepID=UPI0012E1B2FB|nr:DUF1345 domain-containing protein [Pseudactinotalea suaedae]
MTRSEDAGESEPEAPDLPRTIWLLSENRRVAITVLIAVVTSLTVQRVLVNSYEPFRELAREDLPGAALLLPVMVWAAFTLAHMVLTWLAYRGLRGDDFRVAITADPSWLKYDKRRDGTLFRWVVGVGPSSWSTSIAIFALVAVVALVMRPALRELPLAFVIALVMVGTAWFSVAVTYAVHYARVDLTRGGLEFPGERPNRLLDYFYLAAGIQATFGTTDVGVRTTELRGQVLSQSLIAFVFNTVIVGMVISLLLTSG